MKFTVRLCLVVLLLVVPRHLVAAEVNLNVFLGANPLKDIEVQFDGRPAGSTGVQGEVVLDSPVGAHVLTLLKLDAVLTEFRFSLAADEGADISVRFTDFETPPKVSISKFSGAAGAANVPGFIEGYVTDHEGYALPGATVGIEETGASVVTGEDGDYRFELPRGRYTLAVSHPEFETVRKSGVRVLSNVGVAAMVSMKPAPASAVEDVPTFGSAGAAIEPPPAAAESPAVDAPASAAAPVPPAEAGAGDVTEIVVVGTYSPTESTAEAERFSVAVTDVISADDLIRFGDSDVAASLKRVVGVSVSGGKYAVVRGLDGRYISSTLNGGLLPSTDPFRRDVQLDLFPSDILGQIDIQKGFTANLPGDTTGGIIAMTTRDGAGEYINKVSIKLGYTTDTTFETLGAYKRGDHDWIGVDSGQRELPSVLRTATTKGTATLPVCGPGVSTNCFPASVAATLGNTLNNDWAVGSTEAPADFGGSWVLGNQFDLGSGNVGAYATASYDQSWGSRQDAFINEQNLTGDYNRDTRNIAFNSYFALDYLDDDGWGVKSKTLFVRDTEDMVETRDTFRVNDNVAQSEVTLEWIERSLLSQQFIGAVPLNRLLPFGTADQMFNWRLGAAQTLRYSPDRRNYLYQTSAGAQGQQSLLVPSIERSFNTLIENAFEIGADYVLPVAFTPTLSTTFTLGGMINVRDREVELTRLGYALTPTGNGQVNLSQPIEDILSPANLDADRVRVRGRSVDTDTYDADQDNFALFLSTVTDLGTQWQVTAGLRMDNFEQEVSFPFDSASNRRLKSDEVLPALGILYRLDDDLQFRAGVSRTVSRPNVTENSRSVFFDERGDQFQGCLNTCQVAEIDNYDLRAEYYFSSQDSITLALFHKEIDSPLERAISDASGSALDSSEFRNADSAKVSGIELDAIKTLLDTADHMLRIGANVSYIESEVTLDPDGARLEDRRTRDLQGQSPVLGNVQISWDYNPFKQKITLLGNYFDDRIDRAGRAPLGEVEELGQFILNFNYEKELFYDAKISFKVKNLLDEDIEYRQNNRIIEGYKEGIEFSFGYSLNFN